MNILLIDDDPFALTVLRRQLGALGYENVVECGSAREASDRVESRGFDLIFCDLQMPGMDGVEMIRHLARIAFGGALVLVSGETLRILSTAERLAAAHGLAVLGCLSKPVQLQALKETMGRIVERRRREAGKSASVYTPERIRAAIEQGELINHYQPKINLATGEVSGVETLVRWRHPDDGLVFPDQFVGVAEDHGLIEPLTDCVLGRALAHNRAWSDAGTCLHVAVNVSMDSLVDLAFPERIETALHEAGVPAGRLVLEVTESRLMKNVLGPLDILTRLSLKRIGLSIDDFGTGHSSLVQLRDLPFSELKIDRGFVHRAGKSPALAAILVASLEMARKLGMKTVAEGVEDRDDWDFLQRSGCDFAQGWFIAKAMEHDQVLPWVAAWEQRRRELYVRGR